MVMDDVGTLMMMFADLLSDERPTASREIIPRHKGNLSEEQDDLQVKVYISDRPGDDNRFPRDFPLRGGVVTNILGLPVYFWRRRLALVRERPGWTQPREIQ